MEIKFVKIDPTQNMTILVESPVPRELHRQVALGLMCYEGVHAEQVGFIEAAANPAAAARLQMMGGEFCGNATKALAAFLVWQRRVPAGQVVEVPLEVSGADKLTPCRVEALEKNFRCSVTMPTPESLKFVTLPLEGVGYDATVVEFKGITHVIIAEERVGPNLAAFSEKAALAWRDFFETDALGIMVYDMRESRLTPLVLVKATGGLVWERGCGSGSAAVGALLASRNRADVEVGLRQPGGIITVRAAWREGGFGEIAITGKVRIVARGAAYL